MKKLIKIVAVLALMGSTYFLGSLKEKEIEYKTIKIDMRPHERLEVIQAARFNMITLDSAMTMAEELCEQRDAQINWIDKIRWIPRDTLITKYEYYPKYYPVYGTQKRVPYIPIQELVTTPVYVEPVSRFSLGITIGIGGGYSFQTGQSTYSLSEQVVNHDHKGWYYGPTAVLGITYKLADF